MFIYQNKKLSDCDGSMIIETMISTTLCLLFFMLMMSVYLTYTRCSRLQAALQHIEDSAQSTSAMIKTAIHQAGYIGCPSLTDEFPFISLVPYSMTAKNKLLGTETTLTIQHAHFPSAVLAAPMTSKLVLTVKQNTPFAIDDVLVISDCRQAELFQVKKTLLTPSIQAIYVSAPLHSLYDNQAEVSRFEQNTYFTAATHRVYSDGTPVSAFYVTDIHHRTHELVEGVSHLLFRYFIQREGKVMTVAFTDIRPDEKLIGVAADFTVSDPPLHKMWHVWVALDGDIAHV